MADYSTYFPAGPSAPSDYSKYFPAGAGATAPQETAAPTTEAAQPQMSAGQRAARVAGLGARGVATGVAGLPLMVGEAVNQGYNALTGSQRPSVFEGWNTFLNNAGLPEPANAVERLSTNVTGALSGSGGTMGLARMAATPANTTQSLVRDTMLQQPGRQAIAAGTGATAATAAGELGAGPVGQTLAGLAGGMAPFASQMGARPTPETMRTRETAAAGRQAGYVLPPTELRSDPLNKALTGMVAGKPATEQLATVKNQPVTNQLMKRDLGIPDDVTASTSGLKEIRDKVAGAIYPEIEKFGIYKADPAYMQRIGDLAKREKTLAAELPELMNKDIANLSQSLQKQQFSGSTLIEATKALRDKATAAFRAGESGAGRFYRGASDAIEELIGRNLGRAGRADLLPQWQAARQTIAKTHTAEAALNDSTGNFSARIIASQYDKGAPLSGNMREVGRFGNAFPGSVRDAESAAAGQGRAGLSMFDMYAGMAGIGGGMGAHPSLYGLAALPLARPLTRSAILSGPYQDLIAPLTNPLNPGQAGSLGVLSSLQGSPK